MSKSILIVTGLSLLTIATSCGEVGPNGDGFTAGVDPTNGEPTSGPTGGGDGIGDGVFDETSGTEPPPSATCGNSFLTSDEACDDGNNENDDGCAANCLTVEPGYSCNPPGSPCHLVARCGDSSVNLPELCDDGNEIVGDGCSDLCKVEIGFKCEGEPTSTCSVTTCGDGIQEGAETCDDSNTSPLDGCDARCQKEPNCPVTGPCNSECGDGLVLGAEGCDDGNLIDGDGCSAACAAEAGFTCVQGDDCELINGQCVVRVNAIYRDFSAAHPDFQPSPDPAVSTYACATNGDQVPGDPNDPWPAAVKASLGIVLDTLSDDKKPQLAPTTNCAVEQNFNQWYRDISGVNTPAIYDTIPLFPNGRGGYVNRFGADGGQFYDEPVGAAATVADCEASFPTLVCIPCPPTIATPAIGGCTAVAAYDGTPLFFPIDSVGQPAERVAAMVPEQYNPYNIAGGNQDGVAEGWLLESTMLGNNVTHNFSFTTEITYWFVYDQAAPATLDFTGDDDVWVFVNGILAVDLGGIHVPINGSVTIDPTTEALFGLADGSAYEVKVFHAERQTEGSSFRLTLTGFNTSRSECRPECGDGIVGLGEECDDGVNDGGYGECAADCVLGESCGDGVVQRDFGENCDDGNFIEDDECPASCRIVTIL